MKKLITSVTAALIGITLWLFLFDNKEPSTTESVATSREPKDFEALSAQEKFEEKERLYYEKRDSTVKGVIAHLNKPFRFLGRVVDQNGEPIEGVKITSRIRQPKGVWSTSTVLEVVHSKADGTFAIEQRGSGVSLKSFEKEGYRKTKGQIMGFSYGSSPAMIPRDDEYVREFTMLKESEIKKLKKSYKQFSLKWDGVPVFYDLKTKRLGETGDIKITAWRGPVKGKYRAARYDWSFKVEVPSGGVVETTRESAYIAPEKGYEAFWKYEESATSSTWGGAKNNIYLHIRFPDDSYGNLHIDINADPRRQRISGSIRSAVNPSGSRVLED